MSVLAVWVHRKMWSAQRHRIGGMEFQEQLFTGWRRGVRQITASIISQDYSVIMELGMKNGNSSIPWNLIPPWKGWREQYVPNAVWHLQCNQYVGDLGTSRWRNIKLIGAFVVHSRTSGLQPFQFRTWLDNNFPKSEEIGSANRTISLLNGDFYAWHNSPRIKRAIFGAGQLDTAWFVPYVFRGSMISTWPLGQSWTELNRIAKSKCSKLFKLPLFWPTY